MQPAFPSPKTSASPVHFRKAWAGAATLGLALALAACSGSPAPLAQPLDAGAAPVRGPEFARVGERGPHMPSGAQTPATPASPVPPQPAPSANAATHGTDTPGEPMSADPLQDAAGFDPSPQNDVDSGSGGQDAGSHGDVPHS